MERDHKRLIILILCGLTFLSCQKTPEKRLIHLLENKYSNLHVNGQGNKKVAIAQLEDYLVQHPLNDKNLPEIERILHQVSDGHVVLFDSRPEKNIQYISGVHFIKGSNFVKSCPECSPPLKDSKYRLLKINDQTVDEFFYANQNEVSASSPWGREYKILRTMVETKNPKIKKITLTDFDHKLSEVSLNWSEKNSKNECVSVSRLTDKIVKIDVNTLWCDLGNYQRKILIENFEAQWNKAISEVRSSDALILDLRENGGGGDEEVEYILNTFLRKSVKMYSYQFLKQTDPVRVGRLGHLLNFSKSPWSEVEYMYTDLNKAPHKKLYDNKVITLISAGCFSSCEAIASILKFQQRATVIGTKTHGGAGGPEEYKLGNSPYSVGLPSVLSWQPNGMLYEGVGVYPEIEVYQHFNKNEDSILQRAIDLIQSNN